MQWFTFAAWGMLCINARCEKKRLLFKVAYISAIAVSMCAQLWLLRLDGMLSLATALPLHLCGLIGVLSPLLILRCPMWLYELSFFLGAPCALAVLLFPAVIVSSHQALMTSAFCRLHALIALAPVYFAAQGKPLPDDPRRAFVIGNGYLLFVSAFNRVFGTNYLFLSNAPAGTPLEPLMQRGAPVYLLALEIACMLLMTFMRSVSSHCSKKYESI